MPQAQFNLAIIDIDEQDEVLRFLGESLQDIQHRHLHWNINWQTAQLHAAGLECEYDYSNVSFDAPLHHLFIHTKTLKSHGGAFKDELWMRRVFGSIKLIDHAHIWFYSGDIDEFSEHLRWMQRRSAESIFPGSIEVHCLDVFELLYPTQEGSMDIWLEKILKFSSTSG